MKVNRIFWGFRINAQINSHTKLEQKITSYEISYHILGLYYICDGVMETFCTLLLVIILSGSAKVGSLVQRLLNYL